MKRTPNQKKAERAARLKALRDRQQATRARLVQLRASKRLKRPERKPWKTRLFLAIMLLLLLLISRCRCNEEPAVEEQKVAEVLTPQPPEPVADPPPKPSFGGKIERMRRPAFEVKPPAPVSWLGSFRMQVAARSPRLASCFEGTARPGALKWTTSVTAHEGLVSDHDLEPMLRTDSLNSVERQCVLDVLSDPAYELPKEERNLPTRVGLVIEF